MEVELQAPAVPLMFEPKKNGEYEVKELKKRGVK
jgi:hypothetical protein